MLGLAEKPLSSNTTGPTTEHQDKGRQTQADIRSTLRQALDLQKLAYQVAMDLSQPSSAEVEDQRRARAQAVASAIKAWELASDRARIARKQPLPGSLRPEAKPKRSRKQPQTFLESLPEQ